jgi:hypothetical protein
MLTQSLAARSSAWSTALAGRTCWSDRAQTWSNRPVSASPPRSEVPESLCSATRSSLAGLFVLAELQFEIQFGNITIDFLTISLFDDV